MTDLKDLKELAEAATPGPWHGGHGASLDAVNTAWRDQNNNMTPDNYVKGGWAKVVALVGQRAWRNISQCGKDAAFIAAANPKTVLELIARVEAAELDLKSEKLLLEATDHEISELRAERDDLTQDVDAYHSDTLHLIDQRNSAQAERDALRTALSQAKAREAELISALAPFATEASSFDESIADHDRVLMVHEYDLDTDHDPISGEGGDWFSRDCLADSLFTVGDLRRARNAVKAMGGDDE